MKLKNKARLLNELARSVESPKEFIKSVMVLQGQSVNDLTESANMTSEHFYVMMSQVSHGQSIGVKVCVKIVRGLDIDPHILYRIIADYELNNYLNNLENGTNQDNQSQTPDSETSGDTSAS